MKEYVKVSTKGQVTIPVKMRCNLKVIGGDLMIVEEKNNKELILKKVKLDERTK